MSQLRFTEPPPVFVYRVDEDCDPLPCVLCGERPEIGLQCMESIRTKPRLVCGKCIALAVMGFDDMDRTDSGFSAIVSPF